MILVQAIMPSANPCYSAANTHHDVTIANHVVTGFRDRDLGSFHERESYSLARRTHFFAELAAMYSKITEIGLGVGPTLAFRHAAETTEVMPLYWDASRSESVILDGAEVSIDAFEFSAAHQLTASLKESIAIASKHFRVSSMNVRVEDDPDIDGLSYLVLAVQVDDSVEQAVASHRKFAAEAAQAPRTNRRLIRLQCEFK